MQNRDPRLKIPAIRARYNNPAWFRTIDKWHQFTANKISQEITGFLGGLQIEDNKIILNVGAGGNDFGLYTSSVINLDISENRISHMHNPIIASAEQLPVADESTDLIICVGSVINYCDAAAVIAEFGRITQPNSVLVLEYESSYSAELMTQSAFGQSAAVAETFFANQPEAVWVYSPQYINNLLDAAKFKILQKIPIHILSPWGLLFLRSKKLAASIAPLDWLAQSFPFLSRWASNHLVFCAKRI
jgi:ubiquinone/menaquinone biosynthesis C-methylase UbiE